MTDDKHYVEGELYLSLEVLARMYQVQIVVLEKAYELGLLGSGLEEKRSVRIAAVQLDRVATIVRMHCRLGLDFETIAMAIEV